MAISSSTSASSVTSGLFSQMQVQQAQRNAERAEMEARALQLSARAAQAAADRAQNGARTLQVQADQADDNAGQARQGVAALRSSAEARTDLGVRAERAAESIRVRESPPVVAPKAEVAVPAAAPAAPVVNVDGQTTGTLISVTA